LLNWINNSACKLLPQFFWLDKALSFSHCTFTGVKWVGNTISHYKNHMFICMTVKLYCIAKNIQILFQCNVAYWSIIWLKTQCVNGKIHCSLNSSDFNWFPVITKSSMNPMLNSVVIVLVTLLNTYHLPPTPFPFHISHHLLFLTWRPSLQTFKSCSVLSTLIRVILVNKAHFKLPTAQTTKNNFLLDFFKVTIIINYPHMHQRRIQTEQMFCWASDANGVRLTTIKTIRSNDALV